MKGRCHLSSVVSRGDEGTRLRKRRERTAEKGSRKIRRAGMNAILDESADRTQKLMQRGTDRMDLYLYS